MRRLALLLVSAGAFVSFAGSAAAQAPKRAVLKAPPPRAIDTTVSWYVGAHIGGGWANISASDASQSLSPSGGLGGLQIGANYQVQRMVYGIEGDVSYASVIGDVTGPVGGVLVTTGVRHRWFATLAGRLGFAQDRTLAYVKAGLAATSYTWSVSALGGAVSGSSSNDRWGGMLGAGVEQALWTGVSAKVEYNYLNFGHRSETVTTVGGLALTATDVGMDAHLLKFGLNVRLRPGL
jgi:outer membrane immunogenic protein